MRAAVRTGLLGFGLSFKTDQPAPAPAFHADTKNANDVLVNVKACAINPVDYKLPVGKIYGRDFCGTVTQVGTNLSSKYSVGEVVFGSCSSGSLADQAIASGDKIAKLDDKSTDWTPFELASLGVAYRSALMSLQTAGIVPPEKGNKQSKESVLIIGASGGCGLAGVQLAKAMGVSRIVAVCSGKNADFVRNAGATEVVDYTDVISLNQFFEDSVGSFDCIFDAATGSGQGGRLLGEVTAT